MVSIQVSINAMLKKNLVFYVFNIFPGYGGTFWGNIVVLFLHRIGIQKKVNLKNASLIQVLFLSVTY